MKFPVAIVAAVLVWSSARYLPPYFLELRKMDIIEQRVQLEAAKQVAVIRELRAQMQPSPASESDPNKRFY